MGLMDSDPSDSNAPGFSSGLMGSGVSGDDIGAGLGAIGNALLSGTRQNPLRDLGTFIALSNKRQDANAQRLANAAILSKLGFSGADAARMAYASPQMANLALQGQALNKQAEADKAADAVLNNPNGSSPTAGRQHTSDASGDYYDTVIGKESSGDASAKNPSSSASGLGQFTDGTWKQVAAAHPELNLTPDGRTDPDQARKALVAFTQDNADELKRGGHDPSAGNLYVAHFLGSSGANRFLNGLSVNPNATAASYADTRSVLANPTVFYNKDGSPKTAQAFYDERTSRFAGLPSPIGGTQMAQGGAQPAGATPGAPTQVADASNARGGPQTASDATNPADVPAQGSQTVQFVVPGGDGGQPKTVYNDRASALAHASRLNAQIGNAFISPNKKQALQNSYNLIMETAKPTDAEKAAIGAGLAPGSDAWNRIVRNSVDRAQPGYELANPSNPNDTTMRPQAGGPQDPNTPERGFKPNPNGDGVTPVAGGPKDPKYLGEVADAGRADPYTDAQAHARAATEDKLLAAAQTAGGPARDKIAALQTMQDALNSGQGNISTGPMADRILQAKRVLSNFGIDLPGTSASEIVKNMGAPLAGAAFKEMGGRAQSEYKTILSNKPGLDNTVEGNKYLINALMQSSAQTRDLADLADQAKGNYGDYQQLRNQYLKDNPLTSAFSGKPYAQPFQGRMPKFEGEGDGRKIVSGEASDSSNPSGVPSPAAAPKPEVTLAPMSAATKLKAQAAIKGGADPAAVAARLKAQGISADGL